MRISSSSKIGKKNLDRERMVYIGFGKEEVPLPRFIT